MTIETYRLKASRVAAGQLSIKAAAAAERMIAACRAADIEVEADQLREIFAKVGERVDVASGARDPRCACKPDEGDPDCPVHYAPIIIDPMPTAPYLTPERRLELILGIEHAERLGWMGDNFGFQAEGWRGQVEAGMSYDLDTWLEIDGADALKYVEARNA